MSFSEGSEDPAGTADGEAQAVHAEETVLSAGVGMDQPLFFQGSTSEAIAKAAGKKLLVVFVAGEDEATTRLDSTTWADEALASRVKEACVALRLPSGSPDASFFDAIYAVRTTPTIAIIGLNGCRLQWLEGYVTAEDLKKHVEDANVTFQKQLQEAAAAAMAAMLSAFQPSRQTATTAAELAPTPPPQPAASTPPTPAPPTNPSPPSLPTPSPTNTLPPPPPQVTTPSSTTATATTSMKADVPSPSRPSPPPSPSPSPSPADATKQATTASKAKASVIVAEPKKTDEPSTQAAPRKTKPAKPVVSSSSDVRPVNRKPSEARAEAVPPNRISGAPNLAVAPRQEVEEDDGKVRVQFRLTDGTSVRGEFGREEKLRAAKQFVDKERTDGRGSYDLATPFPRHIFTEAEMDSTLEQLGFASRTALALLPRGGPDGAGPGRRDRGRPSTTPPGGETPVANQEQGWSLTGLVGGALSYVNPLSYLRGSTAATGSESKDESPPPSSGWEFDPNPMLERQVRMNVGGVPAAGGGARGGAYGGGSQVPSGGAPSTSGSKRLVGNIHTFNRYGDEDDMTRRKNMFYNGNSTQFGGDGKDEGGGGGGGR